MSYKISNQEKKMAESIVEYIREKTHQYAAEQNIIDEPNEEVEDDYERLLPQDAMNSHFHRCLEITYEALTELQPTLKSVAEEDLDEELSETLNKFDELWEKKILWNELPEEKKNQFRHYEKGDDTFFYCTDGRPVQYEMNLHFHLCLSKIQELLEKMLPDADREDEEHPLNQLKDKAKEFTHLWGRKLTEDRKKYTDNE